MSAELVLDGLRCRFGETVALDELSFTVARGTVFGFLGPNGSGKTTAMRAIFGMVRLEAGQVLWNDQPVGRTQRQRFGYMPEERGLYPGMLVGEQLAYLARLHGFSPSGARDAAGRWMERLGVAERAKDKVEALSLGNQQRVQLAAALVHEPELLILDEPLSGLDPVGIDAVSDVLREQAAQGRGVLFSSHQLDLVEDLCESVAIIDKGRLVASGRVDDLATTGERRLVVRVAGNRDTEWTRDIDGVRLAGHDTSGVRLVLDAGIDPQRVLAAAMRSGPVEHFGLERRTLTEVFREAVAVTPATAPAQAKDETS